MSRSYTNFSKKRLYITLVFLLIGVAFILYQLFQLQVVHGERYREQVNNQHMTTASNIFDRGSIFFQKKDGDLVSAATMNTGFTLAINPQRVSDIDEAYEVLSAVIELDYERFVNRASRTQTVHQEIATQLNEETMLEIRGLGLPYVQLLRNRWRSYPGNTLAAHTLGFVGFGDAQSTVLTGQYGVERTYDDILSRNREGVRVNAFAEIFSNLQNTFSDDTVVSGDVVLTIEPSVQALLETTLEDISDRWSSEMTGGIIIHPQTGAIYAMGVTPSFDVNNFTSVTDQRVFRNTLVESVYEMGSVIKPLIFAVGIDLGLVSADMPFYDAGSVTVRNRTIYNFDRRGRGQITMQDVLNQSLNTGMVHISQLVPRPQMREYLLNFGLGERTGIDLPFEARGLVNNLDTNRDVEFANISFGQGIAVTPIALVRALSAMANGGYMVTPHVVSEIRRPGHFPKKIEYPQGERIISQEASEEITRMLVEVVDSTLMDGRARMDFYSVAAKTGTAQIPSPDGGYYADRNLHSFFGYFPAYEPEFLVLLYTVHPKGARFASQTLAPPFMDIARYLLNYYTIHPDRSPLIDEDTL